MNASDWEHWQHMHAVEFWQACCLAFNINPESTIEDTRLSSEAEDEFNWLMKLLRSNRSNPLFFDQSTRNDTVALDEFAAWCLKIGINIPFVLEALAKDTQKITATTKSGSDRGITKQRVIAAFSGLHFDSDDGWNTALSNVPKWLEPCRVMKGKKGNNSISAMWNPALIASALYEKNIPRNKLDAVFIHLKDWTEEWQEASKFLD